jgi:hypothetical protein
MRPGTHKGVAAQRLALQVELCLPELLASRALNGASAAFGLWPGFWPQGQ